MRGYRQEIFFPYKDRFISFQPMKIGMVGSKSNSGGGVLTNHHQTSCSLLINEKLNNNLRSKITFETKSDSK